MLAKLMLGSFLLFAALGAVAVTGLDLHLVQRLIAETGDKGLDWAVFLLAMLPFTLAFWAVPLAALFRVLFDRRVPAGLPTWKRGHQTGLMAHYRSVYWRGYASLFAWSLLLLPLYLFLIHWWLVVLHLIILAAVALRSGLRQWKLNRQQQVVIDHQRRTINIPPYGDFLWTDLKVGVEEELVVGAKRDQTWHWVTVCGHRWKQFELREHAQAVADWLDQNAR